SLKSFYRCFAGKDDLLLALLEEDSGIGAALLRDMIARHGEPDRRVQAYVEGMFAFLTHPGAAGYAGVLVREYRRLAEEQPEELRAALSPLVALLADELRAAAAAGAVGLDDVDRAAETLFGIVLMGISEVTVAGTDPRDVADHLWRFCW